MKNEVYNKWSHSFFKHIVFCKLENKEEVLSWLIGATGHTLHSSRAPYTVFTNKVDQTMQIRLMEPDLAIQLKLMGF